MNTEQHSFSCDCYQFYLGVKFYKIKLEFEVSLPGYIKLRIICTSLTKRQSGSSLRYQLISDYFIFLSTKTLPNITNFSPLPNNPVFKQH